MTGSSIAGRIGPLVLNASKLECQQACAGGRDGLPGARSAA
jgi:hypothetical protein